ncbi:L-lysine 6-transaminase [Balneolales bacterium ANBcel1]|nr:L-lysine 6-transaminase [Balneolales bacterium ANBcel1]
MTHKPGITPDKVKEILNRHILADGMDMVLDLEKSKGPYLHDAAGNRSYLDFFTFFASNPVGMNHPKIVDNEAFREKIGRIALHNPSNSDIYTREYAEFIDTFSRIGIPKEMPHAFFVAGGGLAVENALKTAFDWKVRKNFEKGYRHEKGHMVLHFDEAFHGRTGYTMSLTNSQPIKVAYFPKFNWPRLVNPKMVFPMDEAHTAQVIEQEQRALNQAERYFEQHKDDIAAIIIEPIQGEGGDNHFRPEFHKALRDLADRHEALLIHDEVQTGVGLTGKFWAHEHYVQPDILAFGKKAQVCGILAGKRVDEVSDNVFNVSSRLNSTWGGNLVDMIRFTRYLEIIKEDNLVDNSAKTGAYLLEKLGSLASEFEFANNVRGRGLMCAFDLIDDATRSTFLKATYEHGLVILPSGEKTVRFRPPLTIQPEQIDEGMEIIRKSLAQTWERSPALRSHFVTS